MSEPSRDSADAELIGSQVGSIRVLSKLGGGGMGEVYRGFDTRLERPVALKTIRIDRRMSGEYKARFRREARILSKIGDPGICQIYELIETPDADFLVLEFLDGQTLGQFAESGVTRERLFKVFVQVAHALGAAHKHRIVHRDLKPENILIVANDRAKILDFGIARSVLDDTHDELVAAAPSVAEGYVTEVDPQLSTELHHTTTKIDDWSTQPSENEGDSNGDSDDGLTGFGNVIGTRGHMSPEQAAGIKVGTPSDIYALGLCLDRLLPQASDSPKRERAGEDSDPQVAALIARMLRTEPKRRPNAREVEAELVKLLDRPRLLARQRRMRVFAGIAALVLVVVSVVMTALALEARRANHEAEVRRVQAEQLVDYLSGELRDRLSELGRLDLLENVNQRALKYFEAVPEGRATSVEMASRTRLLRSQADVRMQRGEIEAANDLMQGALADATRRVAENPDDVIALETLAEIHYWLGYTGLERTTEPEKALAEFSKEIDLRTRVLALKPSAAARHSMATARTSRAAGLQALARWQESIADLNVAIEILRDLMTAGDADGKVRGDLASALGWLSTAYDSSGNLDEAYKARAENVEILSALSAADPENTIWKQDRAVALTFNSRLAQMLGFDDVALKSIDESCALLDESLQRDRSNRVTQRALAVCVGIRASERLSQGDHAAAIADTTQGLDLLDSLIQAEGAQSDWLVQAATARLRLAEIHLDQSQCDVARADIANMDAMLPPTAASRFNPVQLVRRQLVLGRCWRQGADLTEARRAFEAARALMDTPLETQSTATLVYWTLASIELNDTPAVNQALKILKSRGYRGSAIRHACERAGRGDCLS